MSSTASASASGGIGFFGLLTIVLIVLKLLGFINIGWGTIVLIFLAPIFIVLGIVGLFFLGVLLFSLWKD
jgi:hypothetical protein